MKYYILGFAIATICISIGKMMQKDTDKQLIKVNNVFIYQQELKEDGSYELIAYPKTAWVITKK